ncbi:SOS response-associated peptidase [Membranicola marinus]|uniref:Abasic site processing protein n=1 Tax=Membranihabitans marinus TaxID=1227546 RepID=A0A953HJS0_9BACT|nr:SOS response-associated peptidase [Membranihabitans marinus]MBY5957159.1 SOS response-associated peptidase [Membranihabitans marinus]
MCGRSSLTVTEKELEARFNASFYSEDLERYNPIPNYNMAPSQKLPVITNTDPDHINLYRWGLIPFWAKDEKIGYKMINARSETAAEKPAFRQALQKRRCIWPIDGYYEWIKKGKEKIPYRVTSNQQAIFSIAGLWESWKDETGETVHSFTVLTRASTPTMMFLHHRMPVLLPREIERDWLEESIDPTVFLEELPLFGTDELHVYRVSKQVNNVRNNHKEIIEEVEDLEQGELF